MCNKPTRPAHPIAGTLWIAADMHLSAQVPASCQAFLQFLQSATVQADAVLLCGDIFDAWIGDDQIQHRPEPWLAQIVQALQHTSSRISMYFMRGNRDFLLGCVFAQHIGAHLLPDPTLLQTDAGSILLSHGDQYCTDDRAYQRLRRIVRNPWVQRLYLSLGIGYRQRIAQYLRQRSQTAQQRKYDEIMDVNSRAVTQALRASAASIMIHGHTHRPALHTFEVDGRSCQRFVLSDWDLDASSEPRMAWLQVKQNGISVLP